MSKKVFRATTKPMYVDFFVKATRTESNVIYTKRYQRE